MQPGLQVTKEDLAMLKTMKVASPSQRRSLEEIKEELASCRALVSGSFEKVQDELASLFFDSFQGVKDELASSQSELDKWKSAFQKESFVPSGKSPEPQHVIDYIQTLRSSDKSLKEELEIAQMKLAIRDLKAQLKPESDEPTDGDTEVHDEQQLQGSITSGPSPAYLEEKLRAAEAQIAELKVFQEVELKAMVKDMEYNRNAVKLILEKLPGLVPPPSAPETDNEQK
ncbi:hypothetical protein HA466_0181380 [Hirschfeldia incana]|nr:hypothetical protein HA466_0181380 [Hirschfeldia incana]